MSVFRRCILSVLPFLAMFFSGCGGFKGVVTPTLSSISPASVAAGSAAFTLTATGTNFTSGTQILCDGVAQPTTVVSNTQLTASITAAQIAAAGTVSVRVMKADTTTSSALSLTITGGGGPGGGSGTPPTLTSISPDNALSGSAALPLTATGTGFASGSQIIWNGTALAPTTFVSSTVLTATVPAADLAAAIPVSVFVLNPDSTASNFLPFTINVSPSATPTLTKISPSSAVVGSPDVTMTLTGTNFATSATAYFGTLALATTYVNDTQLTAVVPAAELTKIEQVNVTVGNSATATSGPLPFRVGITLYFGLVNDLVWDATRGVMYISESDSSPAADHPNTVRAIDPLNPTVNHGIYTPPANSEPNRLALSDDGKYLYVGLDGQNIVQRLLLPSLTPDISIPLGGATTLGSFSALDLQVAPGQSHVIAVARGKNAGSGTVQAQGGVAVYDDAVQRPLVVSPTTQAGDVLIDTIQWGADATVLYAANNENLGGDLYQLSVSASGVTLVSDSGNVFPTPNLRIHFDRGNKLLYGDDGLVYNPALATQVGNFVAQGIMVPDSTIGDAYFVGQAAANGGTLNYLVQSFNVNPMPVLSGPTRITLNPLQGVPQHLIRWGSSGLAFNTKSVTTCTVKPCPGPGQLYILSGPFVTTVP